MQLTVNGAPKDVPDGLTVRDLVAVPVVEAETQTQKGHIINMVVVECNVCLHLLLFDAVRIGLMGKGD